MALVPQESSQPAWLLQQEMLFHILQCDERHPSNQLSWQFVPWCQYTSLYLTPNQLAACLLLSGGYSHLLTLEVLIWIKYLSQYVPGCQSPFRSVSRLSYDFPKLRYWGEA